MKFDILNINDSNWDSYFKELPLELQDPYFKSGYFKLNNIQNNCYCFVYTGNDNIFFYPFIKTKINELGYELEKEYYDIQGAYGYNGAIVKNDSDEKFIKKAREIFIQYCNDENIIAEFIRFNPLYSNHLYFDDMNILCVNKNIFVDLSLDIWMDSYEYSTRKNVKKAIRNNLETKILDAKDISDEDIEAFYNIYTSTMVRNNANNEYFFSLEYFKLIRENLDNNALFIFIYKDGVVISTELVLLNSYIAYSFLGGTLHEYFQYRPNDFLKHTLIENLKQRGLRYFLLGGGTVLDDGIFKYKKNFSKNGVIDFYIGKKIYNFDVYNDVVEQWECKTEISIKDKYRNYLLKYQYN